MYSWDHVSIQVSYVAEKLKNPTLAFSLFWYLVFIEVVNAGFSVTLVCSKGTTYCLYETISVPK